ncbi:lysophospholipid acyltransferase family protein [candidate division WOR-3 bacterium]|nr:lysophospholipid acyltransferase family protein [candidate division WOR-3 bacterium]
MARRRTPLVWLMPLATLAQFMLPRWIVVRIARLAGRLAFRWNRRQRERLIRNYRHILGPGAGEPAVRQMARRAFINVVTNYLDLLRVPVLRRRVTELVSGDHSLLARALKQGRGAVIVTAHIGNWDLAGACLGALGYPVSAVFEPVPSGWARTFNRYRSATGLHAIPMTDKAGIGRALRSGRALALVSDRDLTGRGVPCHSFDAVRSFPRGPAGYALKCGAPMLLGAVLFDGRHGRPPYRIHIDPPLSFEATGDLDADIVSLTRLIAGRINSLIARFPDQWLVFRADWR